MSLDIEKRVKQYKPLILRENYRSYLKELKERIDSNSAMWNSGPEGKNIAEKLDILGKLLFEALGKTGLNPTEFSKLAGVDERKFFFATICLLTPDEFLEEGFLIRVDEGFKKHYGFNVNSSPEAIKLLSSG